MRADQKAKVDERERKTVVQARFSRQAKTNRVFAALGRWPDLHVASEHGIGRREDGAQQDRTGYSHAGPPMAQGCHRKDCERHRENEETNGGLPTGVIR